MLVITRIHVRYRLRVAADVDRDAVRRAFDHHPRRCPVYRSIAAAIAITTELELLDEPA